MTEHKHEDLRRLFDLAIAAAPGDRGPLLDRECRGDSGLKKRVEAMVAAAEDDRFLSEPTRGSAADAPTVDASAAAAPTVVAPLREGPGTRIGPYKLLQQIGEGGFGLVFMAEQEKPVARKVALKIIKLGMDTRQVVARFEQERQALAMMDHPNIARVLDAGATETGRPFFVMELVKGDPIVEYADKKSMNIDDRLELFAQVCTALQHAHTKGIIHRDIKPSNILVTTHDGKPHAKVIDFGIAKATSSKLTEMTLFTEHRQMIGTPQYMSPEQAEGNLDIDTRTDVYSLGVLLYELLTGTTPFTSQELRSAAYAEIQRIIREVEPPKPSTRLSSNTETIASVASRRQIEPKRLGALVRGELDWIVMKALEKDRQRRYESPSAFAADVRRYLGGEAVVAAPPSTAYRFKKFVRRNKGPVLAGCAVAVALVLGLIGTAWQAKVAGDQRDLAVLAQQAEAEQRKQADAARAEAEQQRARADERAIAAEKAEREEKERADQLKQVSEFHSQMLSKIDTTAAGVDLMKDIRERFVGTLKKAGVPEAELAAQSETLGTLLVRVNATDTAAALIDRTILKPAIKTIDERFQNDLPTDASLREALADLYQSIGLLSAAFPLHESALTTRRRVLGDEHPDTLDSMNDVGVSLRVQGKQSEAEPFIRDALAARRRVLGEEHADTIESINSMAMLLQAQGKLADAEPYFRESLEKCRRVLGEEHENTLFAISNLGTQLWAAGKLAEADPYLREALEKRRRVLGEENPNTLVS
ncbi:MAG: protein kinase domain-containing protein, partial [Phycisphaerae bacterium]